MDQERFDDLAKALADGTTRRAVTRRIAGGALGGLFALVGAGRVGAAPRHDDDATDDQTTEDEPADDQTEDTTDDENQVAVCPGGACNPRKKIDCAAPCRCVGATSTIDGVCQSPPAPSTCPGGACNPKSGIDCAAPCECIGFNGNRDGVCQEPGAPAVCPGGPCNPKKGRDCAQPCKCAGYNGSRDGVCQVDNDEDDTTEGEPDDDLTDDTTEDKTATCPGGPCNPKKGTKCPKSCKCVGFNGKKDGTCQLKKQPEVCQAGADACAATPTCGPTGSTCSCATTVERVPACRQTLADCTNPIPCNRSRDCPGGLCVKVDNCCPPPAGFAGICSTRCAV